MTEGPLTLREIVHAALEANGFRVDEHGFFEAVRTRTRFHGDVRDAVDYARQFGMEELGRKLGFEAASLVTSSERNRFMERRYGAAYEREMAERMKRLGLTAPVRVKDVPVRIEYEVPDE